MDSSLPGSSVHGILQVRILERVKERKYKSPMNCNLPGSSIHEIFQAGVLEWVAISISRQSSQPEDQNQVSHIAGRFVTI